MDRIKLVKKILHECTESAVVVTGFLEKPRKYSQYDEENLFMREVHFLVALGNDEQTTMSEMAERLNVTRGAVTQMATRLEKKGYVIRTKDQKDKRQTTVLLTKKGKALCAEHINYDQQEYCLVSELLSEFSDEDLVKIIRYEQLIRGIFAKTT